MIKEKSVVEKFTTLTQDKFKIYTVGKKVFKWYDSKGTFTKKLPTET